MGFTAGQVLSNTYTAAQLVSHSAGKVPGIGDLLEGHSPIQHLFV